MESLRQIFSIVHTEFLLDNHDDPGLWSERGQSQVKTLAILWLIFLAYALGCSAIFLGPVVHVFSERA